MARNLQDAIYRAEDERFELDTAIETNVATLHFFKPIEQESGGLIADARPIRRADSQRID